ncbi:MAG: hypothetical protein FWE80_09820 [Oscillospiraceae bacterium]|nr:hypothetical protein [Oscillospiraceae bacterium]
MKKYIKRIAAVSLILCLAAGGFSGRCDEPVDEVYYSLDEEEHTLIMQRETEDSGFWEVPSLSAGQSRLNGKIVLENQTDRTVSFVLNTVDLPYDDEEAMEYLNYVRVVLLRGDQLLYSGPYIRLVDPETFELNLTAAEREICEIIIQLSCDFDYNKNAPPFQIGGWSFSVGLSQPTAPTGDGEDTPGVVTLPSEETINRWTFGSIAAVIGLFILIGAATVVLRMVERKRKTENFRK